MLSKNYDLHNVECQSLVPSCEISSRSPRFAKRAITNLSDVSRRRLCLHQQSALASVMPSYFAKISK